jgi:ribonuclease BN (tRNA processing enzyme)
MKLTVLGASGGIGSGRQTTCLLIDDDVLIDAGSGLVTLELAQLEKIDHILLTHSHLDHILGLPLLLDAVGEKRSQPLLVHALPEVLEILSAHIFNWKIWPDFRVIPDDKAPWLRFSPLAAGGTLRLGARRFDLLPAAHTVPACGYLLNGALAFSGDSGPCAERVDVLNALPVLDALIIEVSFADALAQLAGLSGHFCPASLAAELATLRHRPHLWITHLKPGGEARILGELRAHLPGWSIAPLTLRQVMAC